MGDLFVAESVRTTADSAHSNAIPNCRRGGAIRSAAHRDAAERGSASPAPATQKAALADIADAVDMESYAIVASRAALQRSAVVIRAISDSFDQDMPMDFSRAISKDGRVLHEHGPARSGRPSVAASRAIRLGRKAIAPRNALRIFSPGTRENRLPRERFRSRQEAAR